MGMWRQRPNSGFTLIEISIAITLLAAILGTSGVIFANLLKNYQDTETKNKLLAIQKALYDYRVAFNELPCPADITLAINHTHFGVAAANKGTCTAGIPAANFVDVTGTPRDVRGGMVPITTLQLPPDFAFDGWGRRIQYFVTRDLTQLGAFTIVGGSDPNPRMTILNSNGATNTNLAAYVLLSGGRNGHGMVPRLGGATLLNDGSSNADELENCDCDAVATYTALDNTFVQKVETDNAADFTDSFDDILVYATRIDLTLRSSTSWSLGPQLVPDQGGNGSGEVISTSGGIDATGNAAGAGAASGVGPGQGEDPVCNSNAKIGNCFTAGTMIRTPDGLTPIEKLRPGDVVIAVEDDGTTKPVLVRAQVKKSNHLLHVHTDQGILHTTPEHPIWRGGDEFTPAGLLMPGDKVKIWEGGKVKQTSIIKLEQGGAETVYNLEVEGPHTFIADGFIVHNKAVAYCDVTIF